MVRNGREQSLEQFICNTKSFIPFSQGVFGIYVQLIVMLHSYKVIFLTSQSLTSSLSAKHCATFCDVKTKNQTTKHFCISVIYNFTAWCHLEEDVFPCESRFVFSSCHLRVFFPATVVSNLSVRGLKLHLDFYEAALQRCLLLKTNKFFI